MEEKKERDKKVGRVEMDSNVEIQTVSLALRLLPFLPFKKMIKKKKKKNWHKACPWPNLGWIHYLHFSSREENLFISLFSESFLNLLWIIKFCFKSKQNHFFRGSVCWAHHEGWVQRWYQELRDNQQRSSPQSLNFWTAFWMGPNERSLKSYVLPPSISSHIHTSRMIKIARFSATDRVAPSTDHHWRCDNAATVPIRHPGRWGSETHQQSASLLFWVTALHSGNTTACNNRYGLFELIVIQHFPDFCRCPSWNYLKSTSSLSLDHCRNTAILSKVYEFLIWGLLTSS